MLRYVATRLVLLIPVLWGVTLITFAVMRVVPGDFATMVLGPEMAQGDPKALENIRSSLGLDRPLPVQYLDWLVRAMQGDLGVSLSMKVPVWSEIVRRLPVTAELAFLSVLFGLVWGIPLGVVAATRKGIWDVIGRAVTIVGVSIPNFFLGTILILLGAIYLKFIPTFEYVPFYEDLGRNLLSMLYPTIALGTGLVASVAQNTRAATLETMDQEYVRVARAKGLRERTVVYRHILKNALIPVITVVGLQMAFLLGGTVIIETIFALPGIGRLTITAINLRDYVVVQSVVLVIAAIVVVVNLVTDLAYAMVDPRIRYR
ncbi:MAG: ABC transporter permease [Chloroflexi bacterium]|nr:ABC transporter permease [Chloroflexota bacterium]